MKFYFVSRVEEALELALEKKIDEAFLKDENTPLFGPKLWRGFLNLNLIEATH